MSLTTSGHVHTALTPQPGAGSDRNGQPREAILDQALGRIGQARNSRPDILRPEAFRATSLMEDVGTLSDPAVSPDPALLLNLCAKYFHAFITEGSPGRRVSSQELGRLFTLFSRHKSLNEPQDDIATMNRLRQFSEPLCAVADICLSAHLLRAFLGQPLPACAAERTFRGVCLGAGAGLFLLAQHILARRLGFRRAEIQGIEFDGLTGGRTQALVRELGLADVALAGPDGLQAWRNPDGPAFTVVVNEAIPALARADRREECIQANQALFRFLGRKTAHTLFFPEGLIAYAREQNVSVMLSAANRYLGPGEYRRTPLTPQGLVIDGQIQPLHTLGQEFEPLVSEEARGLLPARW